MALSVSFLIGHLVRAVFTQEILEKATKFVPNLVIEITC